MKTFLSLMTLLFLVPTNSSHATENPKMAEIASLCAENLNGKPVLTCDEDNCVGIIAESLDNFPPQLSDQGISGMQQFNFLPDFSNSGNPPELMPIKISGITTAVPLVNWQAKAVKILREAGREPVANYKPVEQVIATPGQKDSLVKFKIATWNIL